VVSYSIISVYREGEMENSGEKTWKPVTAGVLNIITGALNAIGVFGMLIAIISVGGLNMTDLVEPADMPFLASMVQIMLIIILVINLIAAIFPIVGGAFALQRRRWGWALAGSIISILGFFPLGILATIFVSMAKDEFK
jgi:hypothetical protein